MLISIFLTIIIGALFFGVLKIMDVPSSTRTWTFTIVPPLALGALDYFGPRIGHFVTYLCAMAVIVIMIAIIVWCLRAAATVLEFTFFAAIEVTIFFIVKNLCNSIAAGMITTTFWPSFTKWLPFVALIVMLGIIVAAWLSSLSKAAAVIAGIVAAGVIVLLFFTTVNFAAPKENKKAVDGNVSWYAFYNLSMQNDKDTSNDFNFGYNPYEKKYSAQDYDKDLRKRIEVDPALGAATMAWVDANLGTDYLGEEYEANDRDWMRAINVAKRNFMANQEAYYAKITALFKLLDSAEVSLEESNRELIDQMYMNPCTEDGVPKVVVFKTNDHIGWQLIYTFNIKDNKIKVALRIECGYQPTNVAEKMHIDPQPNPNPNPNPNPDPKPDPDPDPKYNKDKTKGTQGDVVAPNDDKGPGEDTNNGVGAKTSTKDQKDNSDHMTQKEYVEKIETLEEINKTQQTGDKDKTNSKEEKAIDVPTPVTPPAHTTDGKEITTEPAGAWGGPAD